MLSMRKGAADGGRGGGSQCWKNQARQGYVFPDRALSKPDVNPHVLDPLDGGVQWVC